VSRYPRRDFLQSAAAASAVAVAVSSAAKAAASERIRVGCIGAGGRALSLISTFSSNPNCEIVALADLDSRRFAKAVEIVEKAQGKTPTTTGDFRKLIDDKSIDALVVGTPDHWHAIPTILGCLADKDVYVEKPDSHNIIEGMRMVAAMKKRGRIVQMGSQHRSTVRLQTAIDFVKSGALGRCLVAKAWESSKQGSIGRPEDSEPPKEVDYDMWLGSAPKRPFNIRRFHGNWRWFYDYGTGDLGNDGVHRLDMAVALLNAACEAQGDEPLGLPRTITATGGKWYFDDMQEFPDTLQVNYEYGGRTPKILTYEMRIWAPYSYLDESEGSAIFGDKAYIIVGNNRWRAYERGGKLIASGDGDSHEKPHVQNFLDCIKSREKPYCDLETVGHPASILCHAGNISARLGGRSIVLDPKTETFNDADANKLRGRPAWRKPWVLPEV
jgi:predicted dehydrogenase